MFMFCSRIHVDDKYCQRSLYNIGNGLLTNILINLIE